MNVGEALAVNSLCRYLVGDVEDDTPPELAVTADQALSALATLAEHAHTALGAGVSGGIIVARHDRFARIGSWETLTPWIERWRKTAGRLLVQAGDVDSPIRSVALETIIVGDKLAEALESRTYREVGA